MRHVRSPGFEALEARKLLTRAHPAVAHHAPAAVGVPLAIGGTLAVDNKAATATEDAAGDMTTSTPVAGVLGTLGRVRGVWDEGVDAYGDDIEPETLQLRGPHGTFVVAFNTTDPGKVQHLPGGAITYEIAQRVRRGTGAYAGASESGSIELTSNSAQTVVYWMNLNSKNT